MYVTKSGPSWTFAVRDGGQHPVEGGRATVYAVQPDIALKATGAAARPSVTTTPLGASIIERGRAGEPSSGAVPACGVRLCEVLHPNLARGFRGCRTAHFRVRLVPQS